jgi:hypothetical protein
MAPVMRPGDPTPVLLLLPANQCHPSRPPPLLNALTTEGCLEPHGDMSRFSYRSASRAARSVTAYFDEGDRTREGVSGCCPEGDTAFVVWSPAAPAFRLATASGVLLMVKVIDGAAAIEE